MRTRMVFLTAVLCVAAVPGAEAQDDHEHPDCPDPGMAFWTHAESHWHYPDILAELTQRNGPRSAAELDAVALELARSAADPDSDRVVEVIRAHFEGDIRAGAEEAAREGICYDERDVDRMVAGAIQDYHDDVEITAMMAEETLLLAAHRGWRSSNHPPPAGIPYDGEGAFEAVLLMYELTGSDAGLLPELNPERAAVVFERAALRPGPAACGALKRLRMWHWDEDDERYIPHSSYERLRRESPERCPELDDPDGG